MASWSAWVSRSVTALTGHPPGRVGGEQLADIAAVDSRDPGEQGGGRVAAEVFEAAQVRVGALGAEGDLFERLARVESARRAGTR